MTGENSCLKIRKNYKNVISLELNTVKQEANKTPAETNNKKITKSLSKLALYIVKGHTQMSRFFNGRSCRRKNI